MWWKWDCVKRYTAVTRVNYSPYKPEKVINPLQRGNH